MARVVRLPQRRLVNMDGRAMRPVDDYDPDAGRDIDDAQPRSDYVSSNENDMGGYLSVDRLKQGYISYLTVKVDEYEEQRLSRHYYHGSQWSPEEIKILRSRRQPIITFNEVGPKVDNLVWIAQRFRADPKAYPRTPAHAGGAEIATQCIRSVLDGCEWPFLDGYCAGQGAMEGIAGVELKLIEGDHGDLDIGLDFVFGDDFFYDPTSFKPDFSDARFKGIGKWVHEETACELFPDKEEVIRNVMSEQGFDMSTHADREFKWVYANEKRLRLVEHWYKNKNRWWWAFYVSNVLLDQGPSPFFDNRKRSTDRFIMYSAAVDHDGDRYGFLRNLKGPQDETNQRRSKALHISNNSRITIQKGAVDDVETARREAARPDGVLEYNQGFEAPKEKDKSEDLQAHLALMQDARAKIVGFANVMPDRVTAAETGEHSGVAIDRLQKAASADLGSFLRNYKAWKLRVYRAVWSAIQHHWKAERYIRVTGGSQDVVQFFSINKLAMNQWGQPIIENLVGAVDVDIILDEGPDTANLLQDAYEMVKDDPTVPWNIKLKFMPMPASMKAEIQEELAKQSQQPDPKMQTEQLKQQGMQAKIQGDLQAQQIKGQSDQQRAQMDLQAKREQAHAEIVNAQQDALARQQDAQRAREQHQADLHIEAVRAETERQKLLLEMEQARAEHAFKMRELQESHRTSMAQHKAKRQAAAAQPRKAAAK
jgi:hypothetical protein